MLLAGGGGSAIEVRGTSATDGSGGNVFLGSRKHSGMTG